MMHRRYACGSAATSPEDLDPGASDAQPCRDLAIPFNDIETRPELLRHILIFSQLD
jgi:hypothetical protein